MKHKLSFIIALWWVILCAIAGVFLLALADKNSRLSESENRMLAGFPEVSARSVASGEFMTGFDSFLTDGFFDRDGVVSFTERLLGGFSLLSQDDKREAQADTMENRLQAEGDMQAENGAQPEGGDAEPAGQIAPAQPGAAPVQNAGADALEIDEPDEGGDVTLPEGGEMITPEHSYLWLKKTDGGNKVIYTYDNDRIATYAETLRIIQQYLPADGQIFVTQVPLASIGNRWTDQQKTYCGWGSSVETVLESCLAGSERIYVFNTWEILEPHMTEGTPLFYHTDHHWSAEGAYIVAAEMLKKQNLPVIPYDEYEYKAIQSKKNDEGYVDTFNVLYPLLPAHSYVLRKITDATELSLMNYKSTTYTAYMNNSREPWRRIVTGANTGRKALVICDSFGNAFTPYILPYYDEVHMTDFRYGDYVKEEAGGSMGELVQYYGIDDIYLIFCTANGLRKDNSIVYLRQYFLN